MGSKNDLKGTVDVAALAEQLAQSPELLEQLGVLLNGKTG